jgi:MFS superfamily sulfate permease-like transporter
MAAFLLASVETAAIGRMFALKHGYRFDPNREFLAIGSANLLSGLAKGFPISGGLSQSLVNESAGAKTPFSGLIAALIIGAITLFFTSLLSDLPQPVLASIVLVAVAGLVHVSVIRRLWRFGREEFGVAALAFLGVLGSGILQGVMIGAVLSILLLLRRGSRPERCGARTRREHVSLRQSERRHRPDAGTGRLCVSSGRRPALFQCGARARPVRGAVGRPRGAHSVGRCSRWVACRTWIWPGQTC